jgi:hypothetical protein
VKPLNSNLPSKREEVQTSVPPKEEKEEENLPDAGASDPCL